MILAIDFDGVIHDHLNPIKGRRMGGPIPGTKEAMDHLDNEDHTLIVHSVWGNSKAIEDWLDYYDIPYSSVTNIKPNADYYIDDRAIRFTSWPQAISEII